jgi:hypothetical protein
MIDPSIKISLNISILDNYLSLTQHLKLQIFLCHGFIFFILK